MATDWLPAVIAAVFGGGGITAVAAFRKAGPEAGQISVSAAEGAVIVQTGVIATLEQQMARLEAKVEALEVEKQETERSLVVTQAENVRLTERVRQLEDQVAYLQRANPPR